MQKVNLVSLRYEVSDDAIRHEVLSTLDRSEASGIGKSSFHVKAWFSSGLNIALHAPHTLMISSLKGRSYPEQEAGRDEDADGHRGDGDLRETSFRNYDNRLKDHR